MIPDAPWIREAENDGVGYAEPGETEYLSIQYQDSIAEDLRNAGELAAQISAILNGLPEDTVWDALIEDLIDKVSDMENVISVRAEEVERWNE